MRVVLSKGAHSTVYIDDETPDIVIKEQNNPVNDPDYIDRQKNGYEIIRKIKSQNADTGVMLPELIEIDSVGDKQIIKEKITTNPHTILNVEKAFLIDTLTISPKEEKFKSELYVIELSRKFLFTKCPKIKPVIIQETK